MNKLEFATSMQARTKSFAVQVIKFFVKLPKTEENRVLGRQLLRAASSVAANYRAVCRAKSQADFVYKMGVAAEEADESLFWLELLEESGAASAQLLVLKKEADELVRILQTSLSTAKRDVRH